MQTAHQIVAEFKRSHAVDEKGFSSWFRDGGYSQSDANIHDSRHLALLEQYVEERDAEAAMPAHAARPD